MAFITFWLTDGEIREFCKCRLTTVCVRVCVWVCVRKALSSRGILTGGGPEEGRAVWGPQVANLGGVGGTERSVTCHQQSAPQSTTAAYIHPDLHCAPCGDKDAAISECEEGAGSGFHSLKPEWAISMLYGLLHTAVRRGEFESFREEPLH